MAAEMAGCLVLRRSGMICNRERWGSGTPMCLGQCNIPGCPGQTLVWHFMQKRCSE